MRVSKGSQVQCVSSSSGVAMNSKEFIFWGGGHEPIVGSRFNESVGGLKRIRNLDPTVVFKKRSAFEQNIVRSCAGGTRMKFGGWG